VLQHPLLTDIFFFGIYYEYMFFIGREKMNLGNNPKIDYDNFIHCMRANVFLYSYD
jgi:hypothetical protein